MKIGFIGLGRMGSGIAENLLKAGHDVTVWNRSPGPAAALAAKGAAVAKMPEEALAGEAVLSILSNDAVMRDLGFAGVLLDKAAKGLIHVNMATVSVDFAKVLAAAHQARGLSYLSSPVFGRPDMAASAQLVLVVGGDAAAREKMQPVFDKIGSRTVPVGEEAWRANLFKVAGNFMIASELESIGEAFALLRKGGIDPALFHDVLSGRLFTGAVFKQYGNMVLNKQYEPAGFALALGLKDVNLVRAAADGLKVEMPTADLLRKNYEEALTWGWQDKDWSAIGEVPAKKAGL
ncbi:MAG TPA: NAD(P)-dependent oxidoreductase [Rhizomicrobium sp.]|jgi:3-hydroxyisobutyrate dehydrogenase-like beta-hydroxyacid dehydrogenase|nr:NAD(P)-dependent oxidoreductase [Rhizomicrobium sp.]